jgi:glycerophosphoryl diester phosphodiesterase
VEFSVIAHRGASAYAPENTLAAFRKAKELGAQWIECDVQLTKDGQPVIFHDSTLDRTTNGSGRLRWKTWESISHLDAGNGERIPTLEELLECVQRLSLSLHLEIKPSFGRVRETTDKVMNILKQAPLDSMELRISSFSRAMLRAVRKLNSTVPLGMAMDRWNPFWKRSADRLSCVSIHCDKNILTPKRVREIKNTGRQVLAYTVNDRAEAEALFDMGVDGVFSNYPDLLEPSPIDENSLADPGAA